MREEKQLLLDEIGQHIDRHQSFVIMRYQGLKANKANQFRGDVAKLGGNVEIMSKRILVKAAKMAGIDLDVKQLEGHVGLVLAGKDPIETTKFVYSFSKDNENAISVLGGRFDGRLYYADDVEKISNLPGIDEMRSQFLATLEAPLSQTLSVMEAILTSVMHCLENKSKKSEN